MTIRIPLDFVFRSMQLVCFLWLPTEYVMSIIDVLLGRARTIILLYGPNSRGQKF